MRPCPKCHAGIPEGMRFCLQCGASLTPHSSSQAPRVGPLAAKFAAAGASPASSDAPVESARVTAQPRQPQTSLPPVDLRIDTAPVLSPRPRAAAYYSRPSLGDRTMEIDDELFRRSFEKPITQSGMVVCRFCRAPLDVAGEFCDRCGAPVAEAAPPGALKPKPQSAAPGVTTEPPPDMSAPAGPLASPATASFPENHAVAAAYPPPISLGDAEPTCSLPETVPAPVAPVSPLTASAKEHATGLMSRLKGLFKKD